MSDGYYIFFDEHQNPKSNTDGYGAVVPGPACPTIPPTTIGANGATNALPIIGNTYIYGTPYPIQFLNIQLDLEFDKSTPVEESIGCFCKKCKNFNEYASPNQDDKTFICYACRHNL